eukprot:TRINITY_DN8848_c0_g1_i1.p1 TRINITY_DN8848_c0_g1~~TRINITY_DN8848_c0_g1_i1.p1  ORF type:complete len:239 (-),score=17.84 TRINITY_DN8848_c0_g1_i1:237-953(-)
MGGCCCSGYWNTKSKVKPFTEIEPQLCTGDVVLLAGQGPSQYIMKVDRWSAFSICGFIIRDAPGTHGLYVICIPPIDTSRQQQSLKPEENEYIVRASLLNLLQSGEYHTCLVRKLSQPLTLEENQLVMSLPKQLASNQKATKRAQLLMENPGSEGCMTCNCCNSIQTENLFCSEVVAIMLEKVSRVKQEESGCYIATGKESAKVLEYPISIKMLSRYKSNWGASFYSQRAAKQSSSNT